MRLLDDVIKVDVTTLVAHRRWELLVDAGTLQY